jgi:uncharacterized protein
MKLGETTMSLVNDVWDLMKMRKRLFLLPPIIWMVILGIFVLLFGPDQYLNQRCRYINNEQELIAIRNNLMTAAAGNDLRAVHRLLREESKLVDDFSISGRTPLAQAASRGYFQVVRLLLEKGTDVNSRDSTGSTALMCAAGHGHLDIVRLLIDNGADVNLMNPGYVTALGIAESNHRIEVVRYLYALGMGTEVDARDKYGRTALILAARQGRADSVKELLKKGADVNSRLSSGETALKLASQYGHNQIVELLKARGAQE